jgi:hypothetical protein
MEKKYITYKFPTSLFGWREHWFYIRDNKPTIPERTTGSPKITSEWIVSPRDMSQVNDLLERIIKLITEGVTRASVIYSWIGRRIQTLQKHD